MLPKSLYCAAAPEAADALRLAAPLGVTGTGKALRLAREIGDQARATLGRAPRRRLAQQVLDLERLNTALEGDSDAPPPIAEDLWPLLGASEDHVRDCLLADEKAFRDRVASILADLRATPELAHDRRGGRHADDRITAFVVSLAAIYERCKGERPMLTIALDDHCPSGPFWDFVWRAFALFSTFEELPAGTLRTVVQQVVAFERETEPDEDPALAFPASPPFPG